jgi:hypothetical protein
MYMTNDQLISVAKWLWPNTVVGREWLLTPYGRDAVERRIIDMHGEPWTGYDCFEKHGQRWQATVKMPVNGELVVRTAKAPTPTEALLLACWNEIPLLTLQGGAVRGIL